MLMDIVTECTAQAPEPISFEVHQPVAINVDDDDAFMADATQPPRPRANKGKQRVEPLYDKTNVKVRSSGW